MSELYGEFAVTAGGRNVGTLRITQEGLMTVYDCACSIITKDVLRLAAVSDGKYVPLGVVMPYGGSPEAGALRLKKSYTKNALHSMGLHNAEAFHLIRPGDVYEVNQENVYAGRPAELSTDNPPDVTADSQEDAVLAGPPEHPVVEEHETAPATANSELLKAVEMMLNQLSSEPANKEEPAPQQAESKPAMPESYKAYTEPEDERAIHFVVKQREAQEQPGWRPAANPAMLFNDETIAEACEEISGALVMEQAGLTMLAVPVSPVAPFPMMPVFCFGSSEEIGGQEYIIFKVKNGYLSL